MIARALKLAGADAPPPRSAAREKLAQVIAHNKESADAIAKLESALSEASERHGQARSALEKAQESAQEAGEAQAQYFIDSALGHAGPAPLSPKDAQAAVERAEEHLEGARRDVATLEREIQSLRGRSSLRDVQLSGAVEKVIRSDQAVTAFLLAFAERQNEFADWQEAMETIRLRLSDDQVRLLSPNESRERSVSDAWRAAIATLETDPDAPLPLAI